MGKPVFRRPSTHVFKSHRNVLVIPDCHEPYSHPKAIDFCVKLQDLFNIAHEDVYHLGDLEDNFFLGQWPKGADMPHTPNQEIENARRKIQEWARAFPLLKICESNHASRYFRKASASELPSQMLRTYKEFFAYPKKWEVEECYILKSLVHNMPSTMLFHGEGFRNPLQAATHFGMNTVTGHFHSSAGVWWLDTIVNRLYAVNSGCLIQNDLYPFSYAKHCKNKPSLGATVLLDDLRCPLFIPLTV